MPSHFPKRYCQRSIGLTSVIWIRWLSMSPQTLPQASTSVTIARRKPAPDRPQLRKNCIRYSSRSVGSSTSGSAGNPIMTSISRIKGTRVPTASSTTVRATPITP